MARPLDSMNLSAYSSIRFGNKQYTVAAMAPELEPEIALGGDGLNDSDDDNDGALR